MIDVSENDEKLDADISEKDCTCMVSAFAYQKIVFSLCVVYKSLKIGHVITNNPIIFPNQFQPSGSL